MKLPNILTIICPLNHARYRLQCKIQKSWCLLPRRCIQIFPTNLLWFTWGPIDPADRLLRRQNGDENYFRSRSIYERVSDLAVWYVDRVTFFLVGVGFPLKMEATKTHFPQRRGRARTSCRGWRIGNGDTVSLYFCSAVICHDRNIPRRGTRAGSTRHTCRVSRSLPLLGDAVCDSLFYCDSLGFV